MFWRVRGFYNHRLGYLREIIHTDMGISATSHRMQPLTLHKKQVDHSVMDILLKKEVIKIFLSSDLVRRTD